jgi:hypothetical protein
MIYQQDAECRRLLVAGVTFFAMATYAIVNGGVSGLIANGENLVALTAGLFAALTLASRLGSIRRQEHRSEREEDVQRNPESPGGG